MSISKRNKLIIVISLLFIILSLTGCDYDSAVEFNVIDIENIRTRTISGGWDVSVFIDNDNSLWAWGDNRHGLLGNGTTTGSHRLVHVMDNVISVSAWGWHTMAIKTDGSLWAWGTNWGGQLGDGTSINRRSPVHIMDNVIAVSAGYAHTLALQADGSLWAWGALRGQLGGDTIRNHYLPIKVIDNIMLP